jgi:hypothetical protein
MKAELLQISDEEYHANGFCKVPCYSNSIGKIILNKSPLHAWMAHPKLNKNYEHVEKASFDLGSAAHAALLEGFDICTVIEAKDWRTKAAQEARDLAYLKGKIPVLPNQYEAIQAMVKVAHEAIFNCKDLGGLRLSDGKSEQTILLIEGELHIKMRLDWLANDRSVILDYKTTEIASPDAWMRSISSMGGDMQSGLYTKGVEILAGNEPNFIFMVQETAPPYAVYFIGMSGQYVEHGLQKTQTALEIWCQCMKTGIWPAYSDRILYPDMPNYLEAAWMEKEEMRQYEKTGPGVGPVSKEAFLFGKVR